MNNAFINQDVTKETKDTLNREKVERLTEIIEALQNIVGSSYWKVLQKYVFNVDLSKARSSLEKEKDTTEMFRLQGEIRWGKRFNLEKLLQTKRDELIAIRKQL